MNSFQKAVLEAIEMCKKSLGDGFHICYPLRANKYGKVYCKHCGKLL